MYISFIIIPLLILFNSFSIGKIFKRFIRHLNSFSCMAIGFICLMSFLYLSIVPLLLFKISLDIFNFYLLAIQILLLFFYIYNWKWFIIIMKINIYKILLLIFVFIFVVLGWFFTFNLNNINILYEPTQSTLDQFTPILTEDYSNIIIFNTFEKGMSFFDKILLSFASIFNLRDINEIKLFLNIIPLVIFLTICPILILGIFYKRGLEYKIKDASLIILMSFALALFSFIFDKNLINGSHWVLIFICFLIWNHYKLYNEIPAKFAIVISNAIVAAIFLLNYESIILFGIVNFIAIGISYRTKKEKSTDYNILMVFSTLLSFSISFTNKNYISLISLISLFILYSSYMFFRSSIIINKMNLKIDVFFYKWVNPIISILSFIILSVSLLVFIISDDFKMNINPWLITTFFNEDSSDIKLKIINIIFWIFLVGLLLICIIKIIMNKKKGDTNIKYIDMSLSSYILFINPFSMNIVSKVVIDTNLFWFKPNLLYSIFSVIAPIIISSNESCLSNKKLTWENYSWISSISIMSIFSILMINII